jgi:hypothetical protein
MPQTDLTPEQRRAELVAKILDLRTFIGSLFLVFGVLVTIDGLVADQAQIDKAAGVNLSLWTGVLMLVLGAVFVAWVLVSPPEVFHGHEITEEDLPEQLRHHGLEAIPEHPGKQPPPEEPPRRRGPPAH